AGVGKIGIVDGDKVEESNLQRQIIHAGKIGMNKAESAKNFVEELNPDVRVLVYPFFVNADNVIYLIEDYDVIVSCPDNFKVRYILNDASRLLNKPLIHSAVYGFEGEVMTIRDSPCYRCMFPRAPVGANNAVMGFTAGFFGCIQAAEAIKTVVDLSVLDGKYLRVDLLSMDFLVTEIRRNPECPVCNRKLDNIYPENYEENCRIVRFE
ncbi:MAG TPA: HesA/MoeB/ThiF family protein, partial [Archaeoglobaceae archaeon]|nr:HesA/MoeB/ThiF family protein [Archaeoglobaceae archaeon]